MKKAFAIIVISLLCVSVFSVLTPKVMGWASSLPQTLHEDMAYDALRNSGWSVADAAQIAFNAWGGVTSFPIEEYTDYYHRLNEYQTELHNWHLNLGEDCQCDDQGKNGGAEDGAYHYIQQARFLYTSGNKAEALENLGYAIHFIQDSVCPPHVFPFSEHVTHTAALDFEIYTANEYYSLLNNWDSRVKNAVEEPIGSAEDLRQKVIDAAHEERSTFEPPHPGFGYVREDGTTIGDLSWTIRGWKMSSEDIGWCMEKAASLVKGAGIYVREGAQGTTKKIAGVQLIGQDTANSCWAACSEMVLRYYGTYGPQVSQIQIAREIGDESYYYNGLPGTQNLPFVGGWELSLDRLGKLDADPEWGPPHPDWGLSFDEVISDIDLGRPIIAIISVGPLQNHAVLIIGYVDNPGSDADAVILNNPWPVGQGVEENRLWTAFSAQLTWYPPAMRTQPKIQKNDIEIQIIETRTSGILSFSISSAATHDWWIGAQKWDTTTKSWGDNPIPGTAYHKQPGETQTVEINIGTYGAGNYRLGLSVSMLEETTWNVKIQQTDEFSEAIVVDKASLLFAATDGDSRAFHVFTSPVGFLTATEGDTFLIMSTGIAANTPGSPEHFESTDFGSGGTADDTVYLTLRFLVPDGATALSFDFRFMSEEYPEYVGSMFNDFFSAYLMDSTGTHQIAFDDNGHIINVNNNFFNPNIYPIGTVFDGSTKRLTTTVNVNEGEVITLQFVVGDVGDGIYDTAVFLDNVRFNVGSGPGTSPTADVIVVKNGPNSVEQGKQFTYTINYFNIEEAAAQNVVVTDNLPSQVTFVSASAGGIYSSTAHSVTWNLGILQPFSSGSLTLTVSVPGTVSVGTVLQNSASITTTSQESNSNNNQQTKMTTVSVGTSFPPNVEVSPTISNYNGIPVLYWTTPITFTYHGDATVIGVDINIHMLDGGPDIGGSMTNTLGTYDWIFIYTFYPRHGQGAVTYTVHYADGHQSTTAHSILVDPSGYVYNAITGQRIQGAAVTLYRFDIVLQQFVLIAPSDPGIEPHTNPQITDENGGYGWMVSPGMYMVRAEKTGYATNFAIVTVPPSATDLNIPLTPIDADPPTTKILIGGPHYIDAIGNTYVTSATSFTLVADDGPDGSGVAATYYRQYNATQDSNWKEQPNPFYMTGLDDGNYSIDYYSTDVAGNVEPTNTQNMTLDNTAPSLTIETPAANDALQDGVTFKVSAWDLSVVASVTFSIQCPQGNVISPEFQSMPATLGLDGKWSLYFDTRQLPDGFYLFAANGTDVLGNWGTTTVQFSIRNWATIELLPSSETNKAGRTMPVKFSIRVKASVDPAQPFIYNQELVIKIYKKASPSNILLQTSTFGTASTDYRINSDSEKYITNFKTLSTPATYVVQIYRKGMLIGSFEFKTVK